MRRFPASFAVFLATAALALEGTAAGIQWVVPPAWKLQPGRPMRIATYELPPAAESEPGECAVFYFGERQGGGVEENLERWRQQFEGASPARKASRIIHGLRIHTIELSGTYLASAGPLMPSHGKKPGYRLSGAIVEAPHGLVFFKCTGPDGTVTKSQADFERLITSVTKTSATSL